MIFEAIHRAINVEGEFILLVVVVVLIALFVLGMTGLVARSVVPGLMTSTGIAGTFWGIFIALNPTSTETGISVADIDTLISGMTTAFTTSLFGITAAIICKAFWSSRRYIDKDITRAQIGLAARLEDIKSAIRGDGEISLSEQIRVLRSETQESQSKIANLADTIKSAIKGGGGLSLSEQIEALRLERQEGQDKMASLVDAIKLAIRGDGGLSLSEQIQVLRLERQESQDKMASLVDAIKLAIRGDGESSLSEQIQALRAERQASQDKIANLADTIEHTLVSSIREMTSQVREALVENLTNALKELMDSLEHTLVKQFGKTFAEFNEAVHALKAWQEDHREHVKELTEAYKAVVIGIQQIQESCAPLPGTADRLKDIVATATKHTNELNASMLAFADLSKQAQQAPQMIKEYLDKIGQDLQSSASGFAKLEGEIAGIYVAGKKAADAHARNVDMLVVEMTRKLDESVSFISKHTTEQIAAVGTEVGKVAVNMRTTMEKSQSDAANKVAGIVEEAMKKLDGQVVHELERITRTWGNHMLSIAQALEEKTKSQFE